MLNNEFHAPSSLVIKRKIKEEVGSMIKYKLGEQKVLFKVERTDERPKPHKVRIVGIGFDAEYLGGPVDKGEYIDDYKWVDVTSLKPEDYFTGGWLKGVQDYLAMQRKG